MVTHLNTDKHTGLELERGFLTHISKTYLGI